MKITRWLGVTVLSVLFTKTGMSQQLRLGSNPSVIEKTAVLELQSNNQGLLFSRISDTALINVMAPPDGMVIYFTPLKQLLLRANGYWQPLTPAAALNNYWSVEGNSNGAVKNLGTIDNNALPFITNNTERMRITSTGQVGIGTTAPNNILEVTGTNTTTGVSGLRLTNLGTATTAAANSKVLSVNSTGDIIVTDNPASTNWMYTGNAGIDPAVNFLGTTDDKQMIFKSNNQSYLEFGRRQTLGLTQGYTDYDNNDEKVTYIRSALQFEAAAANFYKPKMFTDVNGNFRVKGSSAGTDYFEFGSTGTNNNGGFEFIIGDDGDEPMVFKSYHYINGMSEIMRLQSGRMAVGSNAFDATNPEKLLIDAGVTNSYNLMTGKGSIDNYLQINVQNRSAGTSASSDLVATSNNGSETINYIDMGINGGSYNNNYYPILNGANNAYLYSTGNDLVVGNGTAGKSLRFFTGGFNSINERMRIDGTGNIGIGTTTPSQVLDVVGNMELSGAFMPGGNAGTAGYVLTSSGAGAAPTWTSMSGSGSGWNLGGNSVSSLQTLGTISNYDLPFITNNTEKMRLTATGNLGIGSATFNSIHPEKLLVYAGATSSYNLINAKGSINNYLQLNLQNQSSGASASSDIVATANNGTETANFVNMGINSSGYSSWGVLGGANNAYLYSTGQDFVIGNATSGKSLLFFTGSTSASAERMRINGSGNVAIGTATFNSIHPEKLLVYAGATSSYNLINAKGSINNYLQFNLQNQSSGISASSDIVATANNGTETANFVNMGINSSGYSSWGVLGGANNAYLYSTGQDFVIGNGTSGKDLLFFTGGTATSNERMRIDGSGNVGIGTTSPSFPLSVEEFSGTVASFNRTWSDGTIVSLRQDGWEEGTISISWGTVSYNAFTGSHYAHTLQPIEKGMLVTLTGDNQYFHGNKKSEIIYGVRPSAQANDPKIMGAFLGLQESSLPYSDSNPNLVMAVGNGVMWVADKGENLAAGDYLISSDIAGHAMKENGHYSTAFVIARVAEAVNWVEETAVIDGVKHKLVSVFFESFVKNNAQKELESLKQEMNDLKERILQLEKLATQR